MGAPAEVYRYPGGGRAADPAGEDGQPEAATSASAAGPQGDTGEDEAFQPHDDALLGCLQFLARHYERPSSRTILTAGLPLEDGRLTQPLLLRAARRVGLRVQRVSRPLDAFTPIDLPAIILLRDGRPLILLKSDDPETCVVVMPETQGVIHATRSALAQLYGGEALLVARVYGNAASETLGGPSEKGHWFWEPVQARWRDLATVGLAALTINVIGIAAPLFTMNIYDRVLPNKAFSTLWVLAFGFSIVLLFDFALKIARSALLDRVGKGLDIELSEALFEKVLNTPLDRRPASTGEFVNRVAQYEVVRDFFTASTLSLFIDCGFLFVYILVIMLIAGWIAVVPLLAMLAVIAAGLVAQRMIGERMAAAQAESSLRHAMLVEAVSAIETVKTIRAEGVLLRRWDNLIRTASKTQESIKAISSSAISFSLLVQQMVTVGIVVCGTYRFASGDMTTGAIIASVMLASRAVAPLSAVASTLTRARHALSALKTLDGLMQLPDERVSARNFVNRAVENGAVTFRNAAFSYPQVDRQVLSGLNLQVRPGEKIGILGRVGSGKTTIGRLIAGLYPLSSGELLIDGVDIRQYHPHEVRKAVAIVSQDADLFLGSLRENILIARPDASDAELLRACRLSGVDDFASQHPQGYDMPVGERGRLLSTGQRQAVAIARALLMQPRILFLDEPSSAMDFATERAFLARLSQTLDPTQTLLIATHRFSMLALVERLLVVENGRIVADGPKDTVMAALKQASGNVG
jgi:ATP-binding cassette, subfamily C, bacterial LapB